MRGDLLFIKNNIGMYILLSSTSYFMNTRWRLSVRRHDNSCETCAIKFKLG